MKENQEVLQGSGDFGGFDLEAPKTGNIGAIGSYTDTLSLIGESLTAEDFNVANAGNIYFGIHVGNNTGGATASIGA